MWLPACSSEGPTRSGDTAGQEEAGGDGVPALGGSLFRMNCISDERRRERLFNGGGEAQWV